MHLGVVLPVKMVKRCRLKMKPILDAPTCRTGWNCKTWRLVELPHAVAVKEGIFRCCWTPTHGQSWIHCKHTGEICLVYIPFIFLIPHVQKEINILDKYHMEVSWNGPVLLVSPSHHPLLIFQDFPLYTNRYQRGFRLAGKLHVKVPIQSLPVALRKNRQGMGPRRSDQRAVESPGNPPMVHRRMGSAIG